MKLSERKMPLSSIIRADVKGKREDIVAIMEDIKDVVKDNLKFK